MSLIRCAIFLLLIGFNISLTFGQNTCSTFDSIKLFSVLNSHGLKFEEFLPNNKGREEVCNIIFKEDASSIQLSIKHNDKFDSFDNLFPQYIEKLLSDGELISKLKPDGGRRMYEKVNFLTLNACFHYSSDFVKLVWITKGDNLYSLKFNNIGYDRDQAEKLLIDIAVLVH